MTQDENIAHLAQYPELQLARVKAKSIVHDLIEGMSQSSTLETVKKMLTKHLVL